jgi:metal-responsive CopG/Arc/MetJ family transcriptional regulator
MVRKARKSEKEKEEEKNVVRFSVGLQKGLCAEIDRIAKRESRSRNWMINKAAEELVKNEQPLFHQR